MAKVEVKIDKSIDGTYTINKFNGLKSIDSLSQSTGQPKDIYYGVLPSSGKIEVVDKNSQIENMIKNDEISNANVDVGIYINDNLIHRHKSSDTDYSTINKKFSMQLSDVLGIWDNLQYAGYAYKGISNTAYVILVSVLKSFGFDETTEIPLMLEEVTTKLQSIIIPIPFLARDTYRATIDKFCALAQMQVYQDDNGTIKFVNARPIYEENTKVVDIPASKQLSQLKKSIILKNKYDTVEITPIQLIVDSNAFVTTESFNSDSESGYLPSNKELTDTISGQLVNNPNLQLIETNGDYREGKIRVGLTSEFNDIRTGARIEVYTMSGDFEIEKPSSEQFLDFDYSVQMSGKKYTNMTWTNTWEASDWTSNQIVSYPKLYSSASVPNSDATWSGAKIATGRFIKQEYPVFDNNGNLTYNEISVPTYSSFTKIDAGTKYIIHYNITVGYFKTSFFSIKENGTWGYSYDAEIKQADSLTITVTASKLTQQNLDPIIVGSGNNVYTYENNELLAISANDTIEQSQYYKNAQNIIDDYKKGIADGSISVVCGDYLTSNGKLNWGNGEVIQVDDLINIDNTVYKVTGRNLKYSGVPKIDLELQSLENQFCKLNFTGLDINGKFEGQQGFDGTIIAYAVGKPTITISGSTETITYYTDNGFNAEYYNNYNFNRESDRRPTKIIEDNVFIPPTYNNKPVIKVLPRAFYGYYSPMGQGHETYSQGIYIQNVILSENIQEIGDNAFYGAGYTAILGDKKITIRLPSTLAYYGSNFAYYANRIYVKSNVQPLTSGATFGSVNQIIYENTVTELNGRIGSSIVVFKHSQDATINLNIESAKSASPITIYSDNTIVNNYDWASKNYTATIKPLSEWVE